MYSIASLLPLFPGPLWSGMVILLRVKSIGQIDRFKIIFKMILNYFKKISSYNIYIPNKHKEFSRLK